MEVLNLFFKFKAITYLYWIRVNSHIKTNNTDDNTDEKYATIPSQGKH